MIKYHCRWRQLVLGNKYSDDIATLGILLSRHNLSSHKKCEGFTAKGNNDSAHAKPLPASQQDACLQAAEKLVEFPITYTSLVRDIEIRFDPKFQMEVASKGLIALGAWSFWIHDVIKTIGCKLNSLTLKVEWTRRHVDEYDDWIADGDENDENDYAENKHRREMWCGRGLLNGFLVD